MIIGIFLLQMLAALILKVSCTNLLDPPPFYSWKNLIIQTINIIAKTVVVSYMLHLMKRRANSVFNEKMR